MPITTSDLLFKYTATGSTASPEASLGGSLGPNTIPSGVANNIFDDVTGNEASLGLVEYRAIGIHNTLGTHIWMNTSIRVEGYDRSGSDNDVIYFGVEKPAGTIGTPNGTIQTIGSTTVAPTAISFTAESAPSAWVAISGVDYTGSIGANDWAGIWLMRSVPASAAAYNNRSCTIKVQGETSASPLVYKVETCYRIDWTNEQFKVTKIFDEVKSIVE